MEAIREIKTTMFKEHRRKIMRKYFLTLISALALTFTACGGGRSSSGGSSSDGLYTGTQTLVLSSPGLASTSTPATFAMEVSGSTVTVLDPDFTASATLDANNRFSASSPTVSFPVEGITCTGRLTYTGTVSGNTASGNLSGSFNCGGLVITVSGTFTATRGSAKQLNKTLVDVIKEGVS
jgi:hypothetical protein